MSTLNDQWFEAADTRLAFLQEQRQKLQQHQEAFNKDVTEQKAVLDNTWRELIGYLLPEVDDAHLEALQKRLSYPSLLPMKDEAERKLAGQLARRAELAAMDEVAHRDILIARLEDEKAEIFEACEGFREERARWESALYFSELCALGVLRDRPQGGQGGWFSRWRAGSLMMAHMEKQGARRFTDLDDLASRYRRLVEDSEQVFEVERQIEARRAALEALCAEHDGLLDAPQAAVKQLYTDLGAAIRDHLEASPAEDRFAMATGDPNLTAFLRKTDGLAAQLRYLGQLRTARVDDQTHQLDAQIAKLEGKIAKRRAKVRRGKRFVVAQGEVAAMLELNGDKWSRRHDKLSGLRTRVRSFDRWDDGSFGAHFLWWDLMTGGARADDVYEVRVYRERYGVFPDHHAHMALEDSLRGTDVDVTGGAAAVLAADMMAQDGDWAMDAS